MRIIANRLRYPVALLIVLVAVASPITSVSGTSAPSQGFEYYVWWVPTRNVDPPDYLVDRLEEEVLAIVQAGHLAPYYFERGFDSKEGVGGGVFWSGNVTWFNPGDLIYTLSYAFPYLSSDAQAVVRIYLEQELEDYPPLRQLGYPASTWMLNGTRREPYDALAVVQGMSVNVWPLPPEPIENAPAIIENLYAVWTYADATGDWAYVSQHWSEIANVYNANKGVDTYGAIGGIIGYARMAEHLGLHDAAQAAEAQAVSAMQAGLDFGLYQTIANQMYPDPMDAPRGWRAPVFFYLTPEVGRFLAENVALPAQQYLDDFTADSANSVWYITKGGIQRDWGEQSHHGPERAWSIFMAKAYVMGDYRETLETYLDIPLCLGDLYYIQKLVATIDAATLSDTTPPVIFDVGAHEVSWVTAIIEWQTDEPATSQVEYGPDAGYGFETPPISVLLTDHGVALADLRPATTYHFRVRSSSAGGSSVSQDYQFVTPDARPSFVPLVAASR